VSFRQSPSRCQEGMLRGHIEKAGIPNSFLEHRNNVSRFPSQVSESTAEFFKVFSSLRRQAEVKTLLQSIAPLLDNFFELRQVGSLENCLQKRKHRLIAFLKVNFFHTNCMNFNCSLFEGDSKSIFWKIKLKIINFGWFIKLDESLG
jgi:hypothetical protein